MIKHYNYWPDTCSCKVCQTHNTETGEWGIEESYTNPRGETHNTERCDAHKGLTTTELHEALSGNAGENKKKNRLLKLLKETYGEQADFTYSFTGQGKNRVFSVTTSGITNNQKTQAQTWCDNQFGEGKVIIL